MVYLTKKESNKIVKELSKNPDKEINKLLQKIRFPEKMRAYNKDKSEIRKLLQKAFDEKRKVKIRYYSPHSDEHTTRIIDIYQIYLNSIIAYCHLRKDERTFAIERINSVAILEKKFKIPKNWSPESIILDK